MPTALSSKRPRHFPPHPALSWGSQCPPGSRHGKREIRVGLAHTPSPSGPQAASSCWENLHLPRLLQHLQPLCLLKLRLCRQQDVPLPGRGATVYLRGHSEDTEVTRRPLRLCSLTPPSAAAGSPGLSFSQVSCFPGPRPSPAHYQFAQIVPHHLSSPFYISDGT